MTNYKDGDTNRFGEAFKHLDQKINAIGFDGVLYSFYPKPLYININVQPVLHFSDTFDPFVQHYIKNNYGNRDFVTRLAFENRRAPIDWWEEINAGNVTDAEKEVTLDGKANFGIQNGLTILVLDGMFAIAGISVITMNPDDRYFKKLKQESLDELQQLAKSYHEKIIQSKSDLFYFIQPLLDELTDSKKKVLKHLLSGKPMKTIESVHNISYRYSEKLLMQIRQEFGDLTTNELVYILGMANIYEYL